MDPLTAGITGGLGLASSIWASNESSKQAQRQMDFSERMANTAHQREVEDLKKAGLNPILSANAGAASPSGAQGSVFDPSENIRSGVSTAIDAQRAKAQIANIESDTVNKGLQSALIAAQTLSTASDMKLKGAQMTRIYKLLDPEAKNLGLQNEINQIKRDWETTNQWRDLISSGASVARDLMPTSLLKHLGPKTPIKNPIGIHP